MIPLLMFGVAALLAVFYVFGLYNSLIMVKNNIEKAWANIDVLLKQRHDEIPKLIKTCEAYMQFEKGTLERVIALRQQAVLATNVESRANAEGALSLGLTKLFALSENYPDLKSQNNFQQLQSRISGLESQIADRREFYNDSVNIFNIRIESVPDMFIARLMNLTRREMFKVAESDREDVPININVPQ